ncbi:MAG TPA: AMP-binding protein [Candidatus Limnocylindrales bacterium]|nr:AMP-binding protein [Candidatus Limnocylindrales bacterium]
MSVSLEEVIRPFGVTQRILSFPSESLEVSYNEVARRACSGARRLIAAGVRPGEPVAISLGNDLMSVTAALSVWYAGCTLVSVPPMPRHAQPDHLGGVAQAMAAMGCDVYITNGPVPVPLQSLRHIPIGLVTSPEGGKADADPAQAIAPIALVQFTSGSVGSAKGVAISGDKLAGHVLAIGEHVGADSETDRCFSWLPLYHDMGFVAKFLASFASRLDTFIVPPAEFAASPRRWFTGIARTGATMTGGPDFAYRLAAGARYLEDLDLSKVRVCTSGAERVQWTSLTALHRALEPFGMRWEAFTPCYGMAEGVVAATMSPVGRGPVLGPGGHVSTGVPIRGVRIAAADGSEPAPMRLGGSWLFEGYCTATGFEPTAGDWFDTGDAGFTHDGELYVLGRMAEVINFAGRNVFAEDVESVALRVESASVQGVAAFRTTSDHNRFSIVIELNHLERPDATQIGHRIRDAVLKSLGVRISPVVLTKQGTIPRTTSGKAQRARCRIAYEAGDCDQRILAVVD